MVKGNQKYKLLVCIQATYKNPPPSHHTGQKGGDVEYLKRPLSAWSNEEETEAAQGKE